MNAPLKLDCSPLPYRGSVPTRYHRGGPQIVGFRQQAIVDRQQQVIGFETLAALSAQVSGDASDELIAQLSMYDLERLTSDLLLRLRIRCLAEQNYEAQVRHEQTSRLPMQYFVNVEKRSLTAPALVDELIEASADMDHAGCQLVVEVTERPLTSAGQLRAYIKGMMRLKQEGVLIALDDYPLDCSVHWELDLGLGDFVKLDIHSLGLVETVDAELLSARYPVLAAQLYEFVHRYRVALIAEKVETSWQHGIAKILPFSLFQGYLFGRPELV
ncbi:EAL domain-containing protein [Pseudomonas sp. QL9]|uniref:EAL domain-containing protein n=1 Tax=Pseudomonas sp. QL9 TaxID=3242725 RepID=UPI00352B7546